MSPQAQMQDPPTLTMREREVLRLVAAGLTNGQIAFQLECGVDNARVHVRHINGKLDADGRTDAVMLGFYWEILDAADIVKLRKEVRGCPSKVAEGGVVEEELAESVAE